MDTKQKWDLESRLIDMLQGRMNLLQPQDEREELVDQFLIHALEEENFRSMKTELENAENRIKFIKNFLSYGILTELLCDYRVEDVIVNNLRPVYIHHSEKGFVSTQRAFTAQRELDLFIRKLLLFCGKTKMGKIMNLELPNLEGRVNIAISPFGPQLTITKAKVTPLSIIDLIRAGSMSHEVAAQLWIYIDGLSIRPANIIIAGGPGVGKTTLLNALFSFIPSKDRIVVIEDTLELNTFLEESCSRLESDEDVSLADLVKNSLRMRPERIIVGEVRGIEARDMITACNVGKYCICTIHALTSREAIIRMQNEPMNIPQMLVNLIDVFIVLKRYHVKDRMFRVVDEISETSGMEQLKILLSHVFKYDYDTHKLRQVNPSTVYRDRLALQSGTPPKTIMLEHLLRAHLLKEMDNRNLSTVKEVSTFCRAYEQDPDAASAGIGVDRKQILEDSQ
ncbi:MAG: Flp pilus assembly complex ATPase component TadA [Candidatus Omnitrophica bacterium]|nr:Flp pilus assembly complex ATPase component TadA [Candidatus Omnitrophota bacterium]